MKKKITSALAKFCTTALTAILLLALFLNISTLRSVGQIKQGQHVTSGYFCAIIGSGSMSPAISVNDLLLVGSDTSYQAGDIITYVSPQGSLITHRIKQLSEHGYITQGDANNIPDDAIAAQRVLGRVLFVLPKAGGILHGILSPAGITLLGCLCLLIWLIQRLREAKNENDGPGASFNNISKN
jgi:signal peptidase I, archaeal type